MTASAGARSWRPATPPTPRTDTGAEETGNDRLAPVKERVERAQQQILNVVTGLLPQGQDRLKDVIAGVIAAKGAAAGVGILALLWRALGWFQVIDTSVNRIWGVSKSRSFVKGKLFALGMVASI